MSRSLLMMILLTVPVPSPVASLLSLHAMGVVPDAASPGAFFDGRCAGLRWTPLAMTNAFTRHGLRDEGQGCRHDLRVVEAQRVERRAAYADGASAT